MAQISFHQISDGKSNRAAQITALCSMSRYMSVELKKLQSPSFILASRLEQCLADELAMLRTRDSEQLMFEVRTPTS